MLFLYFLTSVLLFKLYYIYLYIILCIVLFYEHGKVVFVIQEVMFLAKQMTVQSETCVVVVMSDDRNVH